MDRRKSRITDIDEFLLKIDELLPKLFEALAKVLVWLDKNNKNRKD